MAIGSGSLTFLTSDVSRHLDNVVGVIQKITNSELMVVTINDREVHFHRMNNDDQLVTRGELIGVCTQITQGEEGFILQVVIVSCERQDDGSWYCRMQPTAITRPL